MKTNIILLLVLISTILWGQGNPNKKALIQEKMSIFHSWVGQWEGNGRVDMQGSSDTYTQKEEVRLTLDGTLLTIEGMGHSKEDPDQKIHHAFATISYHPDKESYVMKSYTFEGEYTDATFEHLDEDSYKWYFDIPGGTIVFYIEMKDGKWEEKGFYRDPSGNEYPYLQMNLTKI